MQVSPGMATYTCPQASLESFPVSTDTLRGHSLACTHMWAHLRTQTNTSLTCSNPESQKGKSDLSLPKAEFCLHCSPGAPNFLNTLPTLEVRCG